MPKSNQRSTVKLRLSRYAMELAQRDLHPIGVGFDVGWIVRAGPRRSGTVVGIEGHLAALFSTDIFQGKNGSMSDGTWPPFSAQLCRNHVSQVRMLILARSTWRTEKRASPPAARSTTPPSHSNSCGPRPGRGPAAPRRCCPAGSAGRPGSGSGRPSVPGGWSAPCGRGSPASGPPTPPRPGSASPPRSAAVRRRPRRIPAAVGLARDGDDRCCRYNVADAPQPSQGPLLVLGPALADLDEIAADVRPAKDQHHVPQLHLGHGLVRRVAVDHQHHLGVGGKVALGHFVAAGRVEAKDHGVLAQEDPEPPAISRSCPPGR